MVKQERIPILKDASFYKSYFRHDATSNKPLSSANPYFEIRKKCIWKNEIAAHRLDFYMVFLVTAGEGIHTFGPNEHYIRKNMLCFVGPNIVSAWQAETNDQQGYFSTFSEDFVNAGSANKHFLQELPFFQVGGHSVLHLTDEQTAYYLSIFKLMDAEFENRNQYSNAILRSQLLVILHKAYSQTRTLECTCPAPNHAGMRLLKAFTALYIQDFKKMRTGSGLQLRKISEYADELGVSQNHLNDTIKAVTGRSAGQLIKDQLTHHASQCLMHANKSVSEIAYALGFEDPSYFARFYKSQTGKSPSEFRIKNML